MSFTTSDYLAMQQRVRRSRPAPVPADAVTSEKGLHIEIMKWCDSQWPRVKYIHARMDKRTTIGLGVHDLTLFLPHGKVLCLEIKTKTGKATEDQLAWAAEMRMNGHEVYIVRSMGEFDVLVSGILTPSTVPPPTIPASQP